MTIEGIETYIAQPRNKKTEVSSFDPVSGEEGGRVILHLTEGHSIYFLDPQLLADSFASLLNCDVVMPDQFGGAERVPVGQLPHFLGGKAQRTEVTREADGDSAGQPPYYRGRPNTKEEFEIWKSTFEPPVTDPLLAKIVKHIHHTYGENVRIGGIGYCFGGRYVMRLMGSGVIDVEVVNHPSFFTIEEVERMRSERNWPYMLLRRTIF